MPKQKFVGFLLLCNLVLVTAQNGWQLLWSDEFDSDNDNNGVVPPDSSAWNTEVGFLGFNREFQTYTDSLDNVRVQDGKLHISVIRDLSAQVGYTSGRINTEDKVQVKYAAMEASIKIPDMKLGLWPAFWTLGQDYDEVGWPKAGEIDVMEMGQGKGSSLGLGNRRIVSAFHWDAYGIYKQEVAHLDVDYDLSQDFHTYRVEWQPSSIATFVDGYEIYRTRIDNCFTQWDCPEFHQFHFMILNVAVAGGFTCCDYGFDLNNYTEGTAWTMEVDYVRVYGNEKTEILLPNNATFNTNMHATHSPEKDSPAALSNLSTVVPTQHPSMAEQPTTLPTVAPTLATTSEYTFSSTPFPTNTPTELPTTDATTQSTEDSPVASVATSTPTVTSPVIDEIPRAINATTSPTEEQFSLADPTGVPTLIPTNPASVSTTTPTIAVASTIPTDSNSTHTSSPSLRPPIPTETTSPTMLVDINPVINMTDSMSDLMQTMNTTSSTSVPSSASQAPTGGIVVATEQPTASLSSSSEFNDTISLPIESDTEDEPLETLSSLQDQSSGKPEHHLSIVTLAQCTFVCLVATVLFSV